MHKTQGGKLRLDHGPASDEELGRAISKVLVWVSDIAINLIGGYVQYR
jgi:hypothetical protein